MKKAVFLIIILFTIKSFSQKDSIVNYLDKKGNIIREKEDIVKKARSFEILTKKSDSLWLVRKFNRNGKLFNYKYYKTKEKKIPIGQSVSYNRKDSISLLYYYNKVGLRHGRIKSWFDNGNKNVEGVYLNGKKEGVWNYYRYNGKLATKSIFKNDSILKSTYFNEAGNKIQENESLHSIKPKFKGGIKKFYNKVKKLANTINYKIKGRIFVNFTVNINGKIKDVEIDQELPEDLANKIINYFENIKGWKPAIFNNRRIPYSNSIPLNFGG